MIFINFLRNYWYWLLLSFFLILVFVLISKRIISLYWIKKKEVKLLQKPELRKNHIVMADFKSLASDHEINLKNNKIIIFVNDFYHQKEDYNKYRSFFKKAAYNYLTFNYRYHHSEINLEKISLGILANDLDTIIQLVKHHHPNQKIYLIGHGFGANIIMCQLKNSSLISKIILLNIMSKTHFIEYDWKLRMSSFAGFWFNKNIALPVILLENLITTNLESQLKLKEYFEKKPLRWWYQLQMKVLISKSLKKLKGKQNNVLLIQSRDHIFGNKNYLMKKTKHQIHWVDDDHDLLWSDAYHNYCEFIQSWINSQ